MICRNDDEPFSTVTPCRRTSWRQARLGLLHAVADVDRRDVGVGADLERDRDLQRAVEADVEFR